MSGSNPVKVATIICGTVVAITVIVAIVSVQITGGDTAVLIRNFGLIAGFLVVNIPTLVASIRTRDKANVIGEQTKALQVKTDAIAEQVNGTLHDAIQSGVSEGVQHAADIAADKVTAALKEGQGNGTV